MEQQLEIISGHEFLFRNSQGDQEPGYLFSVREGQTLTIGRGNGCDIRLSGAASHSVEGCIVARRHVDLAMGDGLVRILDYGSTHGQRFGGRVFLNDRCLDGNGTEWHDMRPGGQIRIADVVIRLNSEEESE